MNKIAGVIDAKPVSGFEANTWVKCGNWLIETFTPNRLTDPWYARAAKISAIVLISLTALVLAIPTLGLSILLPTMSLYQASRSIGQTSNQISRSLAGSANALVSTSISRANSVMALPPIGIRNSGSDCYFSCVVQFMMNTPEILEMAMKIGVIEPCYKNLIDDYQSCQKSGTVLDTHANSSYKKFQSYLQEKSIAEEKRNNEKRRQEGWKGFLPAPTGRCPLGEQACMNAAICFLLQDLYSYEASHEIFYPAKVERYNIAAEKNWIDPYITIGVVSPSHSIEEQLKSICMDEGKSVFPFFRPPERFLIKESAGAGERKDNLRFVLHENLVLSKERAAYDCTFFGMHYGSHASGHWICCVRVNGKWYKANDSQIDLFSNEEEASAFVRSKPPQSSFFVRTH